VGRFLWSPSSRGHEGCCGVCVCAYKSIVPPQPPYTGPPTEVFFFWVRGEDWPGPLLLDVARGWEATRPRKARETPVNSNAAPERAESVPPVSFLCLPLLVRRCPSGFVCVKTQPCVP